MQKYTKNGNISWKHFGSIGNIIALETSMETFGNMNQQKFNDIQQVSEKSEGNILEAFQKIFMMFPPPPCKGGKHETF